MPTADGRCARCASAERAEGEAHGHWKWKSDSCGPRLIDQRENQVLVLLLYYSALALAQTVDWLEGEGHWSFRVAAVAGLPSGVCSPRPQTEFGVEQKKGGGQRQQWRQKCC